MEWLHESNLIVGMKVNYWLVNAFAKESDEPKKSTKHASDSVRYDREELKVRKSMCFIE